jgi:hypothetical protein
MDFKSLSIKNFIGDLPNIINSNFEIIKKFVEKIFDEKSNTITATNIRAQSKVYTNTLVANNIIINLDNGKTISLAEILEKLDITTAESSTDSSLNDTDKDHIIASYSNKHNRK